LPFSPFWDLPDRAVETGILVCTVATASGARGPRWTGLLALFPIAISVVATFVHTQHGRVETTRTLAGALIGLVSLSAFCLSVSVLVRPIGGPAFLVAVAVAAAVQLLAVRVRRAAVNRRGGVWPLQRQPKRAPEQCSFGVMRCLPGCQIGGSACCAWGLPAAIDDCGKRPAMQPLRPQRAPAITLTGCFRRQERSTGPPPEPVLFPGQPADLTASDLAGGAFRQDGSAIAAARPGAGRAHRLRRDQPGSDHRR
jgi:hypothetical protein